MSLTKITPRIVEKSLQPQGFKNKIIGGDFTTNPWARGESFAAIADAAYSADRWQYFKSSEAVHTVLKTADAPTAEQAGVYTQHCLHADVTTVDASVAAGQYVFISQKIEGLNSAPFGFGQAGTRYVTLSFWHKHTKTGTYCVSLTNSAGNRSYVAEYVQDTTNTWEKAVITIPVDITGTWLYDTGIGISVRFTLSAGTTFQTSANTWTAGNFLATSNQVNSTDSTANDFKIALVQLEAGELETDFDSRGASQEQILCERYYQEYSQLYFQYNDGVARGALVTYPLRTSLRASPTLSGTVWTGSPSLVVIGTDVIRISGTTTSAGQFGFTSITVNSEL